MRTRDKLHGYQNRGNTFIKVNKKCGLWALMGAGKTATSATAIADLVYDLDVHRVLIVAPLRVCVDTWPKEFAAWEHTVHLDFAVACGSAVERKAAVERNCTVTIINRENVEWLVEHYPEKLWRWDMVVWDESSGLKNHQSKRWKAMRRVSGRIDRFVQLTGTPSPNGLLDLWAPIYLLDGGSRLGKNITAYRSRWFERSYNGFDWTPKDHAKSEIEQRIADLVMIVEVYDGLPETVYNPINLDMPSSVAAQYKAFVRDSLLELEQGVITAMSAGVLANKLIQYTGGHLYDSDHAVHAVHDIKIKALKELQDTVTGTLLVAYAYKHELAALRKAFPKARVLDKDPQTIADWNAGKIEMLLLHPASAGHGINLQHGGSDVVWYSLPWSLELYQQLNARLARQGQQNVVFLHHLILAGTIDEHVLEVLKEKASTQNSLIEAVKKASLIATKS